MPSLEAVLPLVRRDLDRFAILARSLERYLSGLDVLYVVVPDASRTELDPLVRQAAARLPVRVVSESEWVPDMQQFWQLKGWYRQQLVKLAAAEFITGDFFLTLDADVVCCRPCTVEQLLPEGRARCYVIERDDHPDWYEGAELVLGLKAPRRGILHNVTPVVWSSQGVRELIAHLNGRARDRGWAPGWRGLRQRWLFSRYRQSGLDGAWRAWLAASSPWAEYASYFTFLEATGRFERYHFYSDSCIYDVSNSVWKSTRTLDDWDPRPLFEGAGPPFFAVIQSNTRIDASSIWAKLGPWLGPASSPVEPREEAAPAQGG